MELHDSLPKQPIMLPVYRTMVIILLLMITGIVGRMYVTILEDHDAVIKQTQQLEELNKMPERMEKVERDIISMKTKMGYEEH